MPVVPTSMKTIPRFNPGRETFESWRMKNADMLMSDNEAEQRKIREVLKALLPSVVELLGELDGAYLHKKIDKSISSAHKAEGDNVRMLNDLLHEVRLKIDNLVGPPHGPPFTPHTPPGTPPQPPYGPHTPPGTPPQPPYGPHTPPGTPPQPPYGPHTPPGTPPQSPQYGPHTPPGTPPQSPQYVPQNPQYVPQSPPVSPPFTPHTPPGTPTPSPQEWNPTWASGDFHAPPGTPPQPPYDPHTPPGTPGTPFTQSTPPRTPTRRDRYAEAYDNMVWEDLLLNDLLDGGNKRHTKIRRFKKGRKSQTRKGRKDLTTKKTRKVFHRRKHYHRKSAKDTKRHFRNPKKGRKSRTHKRR
jgi:hypothetical protein